MIRKDRTNYKVNTDPENWTNTMYREADERNIDAEKQVGLMKFWERMSKKVDLRESELKELELQRRISAATEGDTSAARTQTRIKEHKAEEKLDEWRRGQVKAEHEEDFIKELNGQSEKYSEAVARARRSVGL